MLTRWCFPVLLVGVLLGCSAPVRNYECATTAPSVDPRSVWDCNRDVMRRVAKKKEYSLREFWSAAEFLEALTGIEADTVTGPPGPLPGPDLPGNLREWDAWYDENGDRLYWDAANASVRVSTGD